MDQLSFVRLRHVFFLAYLSGAVLRNPVELHSFYVFIYICFEKLNLCRDYSQHFFLVVLPQSGSTSNVNFCQFDWDTLQGGAYRFVDLKI